VSDGRFYDFVWKDAFDGGPGNSDKKRCDETSPEVTDRDAAVVLEGGEPVAALLCLVYKNCGVG
jgi:hypothetical protein